MGLGFAFVLDTIYRGGGTALAGGALAVVRSVELDLDTMSKVF
jgi:FAD/FMN-containing dehydrogenase